MDKQELFTQYFQDILMDEFGYSELEAVQVPVPEISPNVDWGDLWGEAYFWGEAYA